MQTDGGRRGGVEVEGLHGLFDVGFQLFPVIGLGEDALAEGFGGVAAIGLRATSKTSSFMRSDPLTALLSS
jgi:hypothetical protein